MEEKEGNLRDIGFTKIVTAERRTIVLVGVTGAGKSSLGNLLIEEPDRFRTSNNAASCTKNTDKAVGKDLVVHDTPGLCDTQDSAEFIKGKIAEAIQNTVDGVDVILFVLKADRFKPEEYFAFKYVIEGLLGNEALSNTIVVVTHSGEMFNDAEQELEWIRESKKLNPGFDEILSSCGSRLVFVENPKVSKNPTLEAVYQERREESRTRLVRFIEQFRPPKFTPECMLRIKEKYAEKRRKKEELQARIYQIHQEGQKKEEEIATLQRKLERMELKMRELVLTALQEREKSPVLKDVVEHALNVFPAVLTLATALLPAVVGVIKAFCTK